jgi:hypothetical protein
MEANSMADSADLKRTAALSMAGHLSKFMIFCLVLLASIVVLKVQGNTEFQLANLKIRTHDALFVILALSIAHEFVSRHFVGSLTAFSEAGSFAERKRLFEEITVSGSLVFRGFSPRTKIAPGSKIYVLSARDPTSWIYYLSAGLVLLASVPFSSTTPVLLTVEILMGLFFTAWSWITGSFGLWRLGTWFMMTNKAMIATLKATAQSL